MQCIDLIQGLGVFGSSPDNNLMITWASSVIGFGRENQILGCLIEIHAVPNDCLSPSPGVHNLLVSKITQQALGCSHWHYSSILKTKLLPYVMELTKYVNSIVN